MTIQLPDGYNGHTQKFYAEPIEEHADCVKLAVVGKEYMFTWREKSEVEKAVAKEAKRIARQRRANTNRKERDSIMRDMGLVKVRGNLGGTFYE